MARESNYTEAADKLYISQSTLFKHVKTLENELGVPLFKRYGRSIVITNYGETFLQYAQKIVTLTDECSDELAHMQDNTRKRVRIMAGIRVVELIRDFCLEHKGYEIVCTQGNKDVLMQLADRDCDVALHLMGLENEEERQVLEQMDVTPLAKERLVAVLYKDHPFADRESIRAEELCDEGFILPNREDGLAVRYLKRCGVQPQIIMNAVKGTEAAAMVKSGIGISLLQKSTIEKFYTEDELSLVDFDPPCELTLVIATRKGEKLNKAAALFIEFCKGYFNHNVSGSL